MKLTLIIFLVISLFSSVTLADDGNMGTGNRNCTTQNCLITNQTDTQGSETNSLLVYVQEFLEKILG